MQNSKGRSDLGEYTDIGILANFGFSLSYRGQGASFCNVNPQRGFYVFELALELLQVGDELNLEGS